MELSDLIQSLDLSDSQNDSQNIDQVITDFQEITLLSRGYNHWIIPYINKMAPNHSMRQMTNCIIFELESQPTIMWISDLFLNYKKSSSLYQYRTSILIECVENQMTLQLMEIHNYIDFNKLIKLVEEEFYHFIISDEISLTTNQTLNPNNILLKLNEFHYTMAINKVKDFMYQNKKQLSKDLKPMNWIQIQYDEYCDFINNYCIDEPIPLQSLIVDSMIHNLLDTMQYLQNDFTSTYMTTHQFVLYVLLGSEKSIKFFQSNKFYKSFNWLKDLKHHHVDQFVKETIINEFFKQIIIAFPSYQSIKKDFFDRLLILFLQDLNWSKRKIDKYYLYLNDKLHKYLS